MKKNIIPFSKLNLKFLETELGFIFNTKFVGFFLSSFYLKKKKKPNPTSRASDMPWLVGVGQVVQHAEKILVPSWKQIWCVKISNLGLVLFMKVVGIFLSFLTTKKSPQLDIYNSRYAQIIERMLENSS